MTESAEMTTTAIAPWFGCNRMLAHAVGEELRGCSWVGVPFAGGMPELLHIDAQCIQVSDRHWLVINLAMVMADPKLGPQLYRRLRRLLFHEGVHREAQQNCKVQWVAPTSVPNLEAALDYFLAVWMGRSSKAGTDDEFNGGMAKRWDTGGGGSCVRFRSAARSIAGFREIMRRCEFLIADAFELIPLYKDIATNGAYVDPPFPGTGDRYQFNCGDTPAEQRAWHTRLRDQLARFQKLRVVCRFYDHPLIRELYPECLWTWRRLVGRSQANKETPEVLVINGPSYSPSEEGGLF